MKHIITFMLVCVELMLILPVNHQLLIRGTKEMI